MPIVKLRRLKSSPLKLRSEMVEAMQDQYEVAQSMGDVKAMTSLERRLRRAGTFPGDHFAKKRIRHVTMFRGGKMITF